MLRGIVVSICLLLCAPGTATADPVAGNTRPSGPARVAFGLGFPGPMDSQWGFQLGGFGGAAPGLAPVRTPVILVHGNNVDAADWYPVVDVMRSMGYGDQEIWALSYNGLGCNNGRALYTDNPRATEEHGSCSSNITGNDVNVEDLRAFIAAVQAYTGSQRFSVVGHSLGVTLARKALADMWDDVEAFVGIAGANHGTTFCPPGSEGYVMSCDEIASGTAWLASLNGPDETPGVTTRYMTVYDGTGVSDPAYVGPTYADSPKLDGALNCAYPGFYHNDLRVDARIAADYVSFLQAPMASCPDAPLPLPRV